MYKVFAFGGFLFFFISNFLSVIDFKNLLNNDVFDGAWRKGGAKSLLLLSPVSIAVILCAFSTVRPSVDYSCVPPPRMLSRYPRLTNRSHIFSDSAIAAFLASMVDLQ